MLGSMPSFVPQSYAVPMPMQMQSYPAPTYVQNPVPAFSRPANPHPAPPSPAPLAAAPTVRAQSDERNNTRLQIPTPQQLGLTTPAAPQAAAIDWARVHQKLDQLGATCFQVTKLTSGVRVTCLLPTVQPDRSHRIETEASSETEAVRLALQQADAWVLTARR
jgi:hypothetical protein